MKITGEYTVHQDRIVLADCLKGDDLFITLIDQDGEKREVEAGLLNFAAIKIKRGTKLVVPEGCEISAYVYNQLVDQIQGACMILAPYTKIKIASGEMLKKFAGQTFCPDLSDETYAVTIHDEPIMVFRARNDGMFHGTTMSGGNHDWSFNELLHNLKDAVEEARR